MDSNDLPMISTDSTETEIPVQPAKAPAPAPGVPVVRKPVITEIRRPVASPPIATAPRPAEDPRKASEARRTGSVAPAAPVARPAVPSAPRPVVPAVASAEADEDPEKLLREYADRQKSKVTRLEQQLVDYKKAVQDRDTFRSKAEALAKDLAEARKQLEAAAKNEEVIKDLQAKLDASLLSHTMGQDDNNKLKAKVAELGGSSRRNEERAVLAERSLADTKTALATQAEARKESETRVAAAIQALQGQTPSTVNGASARPTALDIIPTRPMPKTEALTADVKPPAPQGKPLVRPLGRPSLPGRR